MKVCASCNKEMTCVKTATVADFGGGHLYRGDIFQCPTCKATIFSSDGRPFYQVELPRSDFDLDMLSPKDGTSERVKELQLRSTGLLLQLENAEHKLAHYCEEAPDRPTARICNAWRGERTDHNRHLTEHRAEVTYLKTRIKELEEKLLQQTIVGRGYVPIGAMSGSFQARPNLATSDLPPGGMSGNFKLHFDGAQTPVEDDGK